MSMATTFWSHVDMCGPDECWPWTGFRDMSRGGYGKLMHGGTSHQAHRVAWTRTFGEIPNGLWVLHRCDNPPCCNPAHLFVGTASDNNNDRVAKGRNAPFSVLSHAGVTNGRAVLTEEQVREIRRLYVKGHRFRSSETDAIKLARRYNVTPPLILAIVKRRRWPYVEA